MKKIIICLLLFVLPGISYSADESKRESVEELLALTNAESMLDTIYSQVGQMFQGMGQQLGVKPSDREVFDKFMSKMFSLMKEEMSWDKMKEPMIKIYLKHFTEKEIQDQIAFYKSDSGQSLVRKQPEIAKDLVALSQESLKDFLPKLQKISKELEQELGGVRYYNSVAAADLRNAMTAQEAYYVDHASYTDSLEELTGEKKYYGLIINEGVTLRIISGDKTGYTMEAFHKNGDIKLQVKGPGGVITSKRMSTVEPKKDLSNNAKWILRYAATAQEAYYVDHKSYTQNKDELHGIKPLEEGFHFNIIRAGKEYYEMEVYHDNGTEIYNIKGPGGVITSKPKGN